MACFLVPAAEGVVSTIVSKSAKNNEIKAVEGHASEETVKRIPFPRSFRG
jgi:hypothetical protein